VGGGGVESTVMAALSLNLSLFLYDDGRCVKTLPNTDLLIACKLLISAFPSRLSYFIHYTLSHGMYLHHVTLFKPRTNVNSLITSRKRITLNPSHAWLLSFKIRTTLIFFFLLIFMGCRTWYLRSIEEQQGAEE
jgi:hypothetical protein